MIKHKTDGTVKVILSISDEGKMTCRLDHNNIPQDRRLCNGNENYWVAFDSSERVYNDGDTIYFKRVFISDANNHTNGALLIDRDSSEGTYISRQIHFLSSINQLSDDFVEMSESVKVCRGGAFMSLSLLPNEQIVFFANCNRVGEGQYSSIRMTA